MHMELLLDDKKKSVDARAHGFGHSTYQHCTLAFGILDFMMRI